MSAIFGNLNVTWILDESINRLKLDPQSKKMILVRFMD